MYATSLVTLMPGYLNDHAVDHTFIVGRALWSTQCDGDVVLHTHAFMPVCLNTLLETTRCLGYI